MNERRATVIKAYESAYPNPLKLAKDTEVAIGEKDCEWAGWLWCEAPDGNKGWVPESYVAREGDQGRLTRDYDATELTVAVGDELAILGEEAGWLWCRTASGAIGWVPLENVRLDASV